MTYEADELERFMFQHEMDHLDGVLLIERLDEDTRKAPSRRCAICRSVAPKRSRPAAVSPCRDTTP